jgi:hypothetical protein
MSHNKTVLRIKAKIKPEASEPEPECVICYEPSQTLQAMCPSHSYCTRCILNYLQTQADVGAFCCMDPSCRVPVPMSLIRTCTADAPISVRQKIVLAYKGQHSDGKCEYCHGSIVKVKTPHPRQTGAYYLKKQCTLCDECYCSRCNKKMHRGLCVLDPDFEGQKVDHCPNCNEGYVLEEGCTSVRCTKCHVNFSFQNASSLYAQPGIVNTDENGALIWEGDSVHNNDPHMTEYAHRPYELLPLYARYAYDPPRVMVVRDAQPLVEANVEDFTTERFKAMRDGSRGAIQDAGGKYFTVDTLKRFCIKNHFSGYSKYRRPELVEFIYRKLDVSTELTV